MLWSTCEWLQILILFLSVGIEGLSEFRNITDNGAFKNIKYINLPSSFQNMSHRRLFSDNSRHSKIFHEILDDVRNIMRALPLVAANVSETGHDVVDVKRLFYGVLEDIRFLKDEVSVIKRQTTNIWQNVSDVRRDLNRMNQVLEGTVDGFTKKEGYTNSSIENLTDMYGVLEGTVDGFSKKEGYTNSSIENLTDMYRMLEGTVDGFTRREGYTNSSIENLTDMYKDIQTNYDNKYNALKNNMTKTHHGLQLIQMLWPVIEIQINQTLTKLDGLIESHHRMYAQIRTDREATSLEILRIEEKMDIAFIGMGSEAHRNQVKVEAILLELMNQLKELRFSIESSCQQGSRPSGRITRVLPKFENFKKLDNLKGLINLKNPRMDINSLSTLMQWLPMIERLLGVVDDFKEKNPITGVGGIAGGGQLTGIPGLIKNLLGVFGGVGGLLVYPQASIDFPALVGGLPFFPSTPGPPSFPISGIFPGIPAAHPAPIGTPRPAQASPPQFPFFPEGPSWAPDSPPAASPEMPYPGYPGESYPPAATTAAPFYPTASPYPGYPGGPPSTPSPIHPTTSHYPSYPGGAYPAPISPPGDYPGGLYPPESPMFPPIAPYPGYPGSGYPPAGPKPPSPYPSFPDYPGSGGYPPSTTPSTIPSYPDVNYPPGYPPSPIISPPSVPPAITIPGMVPTTPESQQSPGIPYPSDPVKPPQISRPILPLILLGDGIHCACICPCECTCPLVPRVSTTTTTTTPTPWWDTYNQYSTKSVIREACECLCSCPCPRNDTSQPIHTTPAQTITTSKRPIQTSTSSIYEEAMATDRWPPEPILPGRPTPVNTGNGASVDEVRYEINKIKEDLRILSITMKEEMDMTRQAITGQMNARFDEIKYILSDMHHNNIIMQSRNFNMTSDVRERTTHDFNKTFNVLRSMSGVMLKMNGAVELIMNADYMTYDGRHWRSKRNKRPPAQRNDTTARRTMQFERNFPRFMEQRSDEQEYDDEILDLDEFEDDSFELPVLSTAKLPDDVLLLDGDLKSMIDLPLQDLKLQNMFQKNINKELMSTLKQRRTGRIRKKYPIHARGVLKRHRPTRRRPLYSMIHGLNPFLDLERYNIRPSIGNRPGRGSKPSIGLRPGNHHKIYEHLPPLPPEVMTVARNGKPFSFAYSDGRGSNWNINVNRRNYLDEESEGKVNEMEEDSSTENLDESFEEILSESAESAEDEE